MKKEIVSILETLILMSGRRRMQIGKKCMSYTDIQTIMKNSFLSYALVGILYTV